MGISLIPVDPTEADAPLLLRQCSVGPFKVILTVFFAELDKTEDCETNTLCNKQ